MARAFQARRQGGRPRAMIRAVDAWVGLVGAVVGGLLTLGGQQLTARSEANRQHKSELLSNISTLVALSDDYRNRVWEERQALKDSAVANWDLTTFRLAQARLRVLLNDEDVLAAIDELQDAGIALGRLWRTQRVDGPEVQAAWERHKEALARFLDAGRRLLA
jgi:hypothetical protein